MVPFEDRGRNFGEYWYLGVSIYRKTDRIPAVHVRVKKSKDRVHWENFESDKYWIGPDVLSVLWDDNIKKYVMYYKLWIVEGKTSTGDWFLNYFTGFKPSIEGRIYKVEGLSVLPEKRYISEKLEYGGGTEKDGGGGFTDEKVTMIRIIARAESSDFINWEKESVIIEPPLGAPLGDQSYGMDVKIYGGMYRHV